MQKKNRAEAREEVEVGSWDDIFNVAGWRPREHRICRTTLGKTDMTKDTKSAGTRAMLKASATAPLKHGASMNHESRRWRLH